MKDKYSLLFCYKISISNNANQGQRDMQNTQCLANGAPLYTRFNETYYYLLKQILEIVTATN